MTHWWWHFHKFIFHLHLFPPPNHFIPHHDPSIYQKKTQKTKKNPNIILGTSRRRDPDELSSSGYSSSAINAEYYPVSTETMDTGDYELYDPRIHAKPRLQIQPRKTIRPEVVNYPSIQISLLLYPA